MTTHLATSDPLSICNGFALFPGIGTVRAGVSSKETFGTLRRYQQIRCSTGARSRSSITSCSSESAVRPTRSGWTLWSTRKNGQVVLTVSGDELQAGFFFGINFQIGVTINLQQYTPHAVWKHWHPSLQWKWDQVASANVSIKFDVIDVIRTVIVIDARKKR